MSNGADMKIPKLDSFVHCRADMMARTTRRQKRYHNLFRHLLKGAEQ